MSHPGHGRVVYEGCGHLHHQCRCPGPKEESTTPGRCPDCVAKGAPVPGGTGALDSKAEGWRWAEAAGVFNAKAFAERLQSAFARAHAAGQATRDASAEGVLLARAVALLGDIEAGGWLSATYRISKRVDKWLADARAAAVPGAVEETRPE